MLKINIGLSRKVSADYNSRGFSVNIEGELPSELLHDEEGLRSTCDRLYDLANSVLEEQVQKSTEPSARQPARTTERFEGRSNGRSHERTNGNGNGRSYGRDAQERSSRNPDRNERLLTQAQGRAIQNMARKVGADPHQWARDEFGVNQVEDLTLKQASEAIDSLKRQIDGPKEVAR